jgi:hypothetical protein
LCASCGKRVYTHNRCEGCQAIGSTLGACSFCPQFGKCECGGILFPAALKKEKLLAVILDLLDELQTPSEDGMIYAERIFNELMEGGE